jgi:hypothetical protein
MDVALTMERYYSKKQENKGVEPLPDYTSKDLLEIFNRNKA